MTETTSRNDKQFFGDYAKEWWAEDSIMAPLRSFNPLRFEYFGRYLPDLADKEVLDVGCGGGYTCEYLDDLGAVVTGVEVNSDLVTAARAHAEEVGKDIRYVDGIAEALPFEDDSFDVVTCVDVLEHVDDVELAVSEIARVLRPGGWFLYDTINRTMWARVTMIWMPERVLGIVPRGAHDHAKFITPREMLVALGAAGLTPIGEPAGIDIRGQRPDGSLKAKLVRRTAGLYLGVAKLQRRAGRVMDA